MMLAASLESPSPPTGSSDKELRMRSASVNESSEFSVTKAIASATHACK